MSHDQLPKSSEPARISETVEVPAEHRIDSATGMSPAAQEAAQRVADADVRKEARRLKRKKGLVRVVGGMMAVATVGGLGTAYVASKGGESVEPTFPDQPENSAPVTPGSPEVEEPIETAPVNAQELRESLTYTTNYDYYVDDRYFAEIERFGGIDAQLEAEYVDEAGIRGLIQEKLTNLTTALETGSEDAIIASYRQSGLGEYGDLDGSVGSLRDQAAYKQGLVEADPTLPVSFIGLVSLNSISPGLDKNSMEVSFTLERTDYGVDAEGAPREYKTVEDWTWILEREDTVAGWSDGGTRSNWSIAQETLENLNDVKE